MGANSVILLLIVWLSERREKWQWKRGKEFKGMCLGVGYPQSPPRFRSKCCFGVDTCDTGRHHHKHHWSSIRTTEGLQSLYLCTDIVSVMWRTWGFYRTKQGNLKGWKLNIFWLFHYSVKELGEFVCVCPYQRFQGCYQLRSTFLSRNFRSI